MNSLFPRAIIHVDMDTFFVSVERKLDPSLEGQPVIVGGGPGGRHERGVVAACSYETRVFGVHSAMPLAQAKKLCPKAIIVPVGRSNYGVETAHVREIIESFTDLYEMTSPDEAYIDLKGTERLHGTPVQAADKLRRAIRDQTGLPVSVGLGNSKTVAKICSKLSKPKGLFVAWPGGEAALLRPLGIRSLPGLGPKTAAGLQRHGIQTLGDLVDFGEQQLVDLFGDHARSLWRRAQGECASEIQTHRERLQISTENTFGDNIGEREWLHAELARMVMKVGERLRKKGQWACTLTIKLRSPDFQTITRQVPLHPATQSDQPLIAASRAAFDRYWDGRPLRLLGVGLSNLVGERQSDMFDASDDEKQDRLQETVDRLRSVSGASLTWGSALGTKPRRTPPERGT